MSEIVNTSALPLESDQTIVAEMVPIEDDRPTVIKVDHVSMMFNMASERLSNLKEYFLKIVKHQLFYEELIALDDISFKVKKGDVFGILGTNGSGKSTLLKIIAGVLEPTKGTVEISGAIAPLIELGAGFDMDLSARENIYLNGALLGYSREFICEHFDEIVEFAEVENFLDMPMKNYSSGMVARIAFAIATVIVPEILIVDEVLSVGDFMFQQKCEDRISELIENHGVTVLIVSHNNDQIERLCNKAMWIEKGHLRVFGDAAQVCNAYRVLGGRTGSQKSEEAVYRALKIAEDDRLSIQTEEKFQLEIIRGENHFSIAANLAFAGWTKDECDNVVLVPDFAHSFSITVSGIAGSLNAPILPVKTDAIPLEVLHALDKLSPSRIYIVAADQEFQGIAGALSLYDNGADVIRIPRKVSGDSGMLAFGAERNLWDSDFAILCFFSDPLAAFGASSIAYSAQAPFLIPDYTEGGLDNGILEQLQNNHIEKIVALGSLSENCTIANQLDEYGFDLIPLSTDYRFEAINISQTMLGLSEVDPNMLCVSTANLSRWQDLISVGAYAGKRKSIVLLEDSTSLDNVAECMKFVGNMSPRRITFAGYRNTNDIEARILLAGASLSER